MTRDEVEEIGRRIDAGFSGIRAEMAEQGKSLRAEMAEQIGGLRGELRAEMAEQGKSLRAEMGEQIGGLRSELRAEMAEQGKSLRAEMGDVRLEVGALRTEVARVADETHVNGLRIEASSDQLRMLANGISAANGKIDGVAREVAVLAVRADGVDLRLNQISSDVQRAMAQTRVDLIRLQERQQQLEDGQTELRQRIERHA